ncbi:MAG: UDP-2,3-diacylglucosamine diphosphatase [Tannerella sp.]|jgi:UDP-2,3-diacylglucosamine pyrophosphatase LpxH|nr:UDP-2,3-diacylglucosamine diphosphatase [Tannerella sp.]
MIKTKHYKTIVLSDIHLGSKWSKTEEAAGFLEKNTCDTLILCGDIIDGWNIMRGNKEKWNRQHTGFIKLLLDIRHDTQIIYIRGNHDDFLERILPVTFHNIRIVKDFIYRSCNKQFYVVHGDIFDTVTSRFKWLSKIGDRGYTLLLWINRQYNNKRLKKGLPYDSISRRIKAKVKASVSYISDYENHIVSIARKKNCDGVICGHIHHPEMRYYGDTLYLNAGDWVESLSALTEDYEGNWQLVFHAREADCAGKPYSHDIIPRSV